MHHTRAADDVGSQRVLHKMTGHRDDEVAGCCRHAAVRDKLKRVRRVLEEGRRMTEVTFDSKDLAEEHSTRAKREVSAIVGLRHEIVRRVSSIGHRDERLQLPLSSRRPGRRHTNDRKGEKSSRRVHYLTTKPRNTRANGDTVTSPALSVAGLARPSLFARRIKVTLRFGSVRMSDDDAFVPTPNCHTTGSPL